MVDKSSISLANRDGKFARVTEHQTSHSPTSSRFTPQLDEITAGRLVLASHAAHLHLTASTQPDELCAADFVEQFPGVHVQEGVITLRYGPPTQPLISRSQPRAQIALNPTVPWEIEFRGALSYLNADLAAIQVVALDMVTVNMAHLRLPASVGTANIYVAGSVSNLTLLRPAGVAMRLHVAGAASNVILDDHHITAAATPIHWQSANYATTPHRYEVRVAGSVSDLTVGYW